MARPRTFFTADLHLFHDNILVYEKEFRPYSSLEEMHQDIEQKWNKDVTPNDTVIVVGDVCYGHKGLDFMYRLNGRKELVRGNHDEWFTEAELLGPFSKVHSYRKFAGCIVSHIPVHPQQLESRYLANIHGHLHDLNIRLPNKSPDPRYINVSVEQWDMRPVCWEELEPRLRTLEKLAKKNAK